jgi:hypothetical protein
MRIIAHRVTQCQQQVMVIHPSAKFFAYLNVVLVALLDVTNIFAQDAEYQAFARCLSRGLGDGMMQLRVCAATNRPTSHALSGIECANIRQNKTNTMLNGKDSVEPSRMLR